MDASNFDQTSHIRHVNDDEEEEEENLYLQLHVDVHAPHIITCNGLRVGISRSFTVSDTYRSLYCEVGLTTIDRRTSMAIYLDDFEHEECVFDFAMAPGQTINGMLDCCHEFLERAIEVLFSDDHIYQSDDAMDSGSDMSTDRDLSSGQN